MTEYNIIGDIAGQYGAFLALIAQMPQDATVLSVGDMIDRGPDSDKVISWFMNRENEAIALMGNHEHLMLNEFKDTGFYEKGCWIENGGAATYCSYNKSVPPEVLDWLEQLPLYHQDEGLLVTHAPINPCYGLERACNLGTGFANRWHIDWQSEHSVIWNRGTPRRIAGVYQVFGHRSEIGLKDFGVPASFATCIDTSRKKILTGLHWPSKKIYQQPYLGE